MHLAEIEHNAAGTVRLEFELGGIEQCVVEVQLHVGGSAWRAEVLHSAEGLQLVACRPRGGACVNAVIADIFGRGMPIGTNTGFRLPKLEVLHVWESAVAEQVQRGRLAVRRGACVRRADALAMDSRRPRAGLLPARLCVRWAGWRPVAARARGGCR